MRLTCILLLLSACSGCGHIDRASVNAYRNLRLGDYVIIAPKGRAQLNCVTRFLAFKKQQGFHVTLLEFNNEAPELDRLVEVQKLLLAKRPPAGQLAYALLIASQTELPMTSISVAKGTDVFSDLALYLRPQPAARNKPDRKFWRDLVEPDFPWIFGRLPFADEKSLQASIESTITFERPDDATPLALLGAERIDTPSDAAWVMNLVKRRFQANGWRSLLCATDRPCDVRLSVDTIEKRAQAGFELIGRWSCDHPRVVYALSHGGDEMGEYNGRTIHGQGHHLISHIATAAVTGNISGFSAPAVPAIFITSGCEVGSPGNALMDLLLARKWAAAILAPTAITASDPLVPSIQADINIAQCIAGGLSVGVALRAVRNTYYRESRHDLVTLLSEETRTSMAQNIVTYTIYGDPSLTCPVSDRANKPQATPAR